LDYYVYIIDEWKKYLGLYNKIRLYIVAQGLLCLHDLNNKQHHM